MERVLIHVDYTNDFVAPDGALTSGKPGQAIHDKVLELTKQFYENDEYIAFTIDLHEKENPYHPEIALFPPHNLEGTKGRELYGDLENYFQQIKENENVYYTPKTRYSAFAGTDLEIKLRERDIKEVHIIGVVTDICVLHTAVDAYNKGFNIVIHKDAVASFNQAGHVIAIPHGTDESKPHIKASGITVVQVPDGVNFAGEDEDEEKLTTVVFGIAGVGDEHLDILQQIAVYASDVENVVELANADSEEKIMELLEGVE